MLAMAVLVLFIPDRLVAAQEIGWKARGKGGAVAAGKAEAVAAGIETLKRGGNAADAAAATILALAVSDYGLFSIGGEVPLLIYRADRQEVKVLCGVGRAPLDPRAVDWFYANGIPSKGSLKAAPAPGAVDLCVTLLKLHGTKSLEETIAPTLALLDAGGRDWHPRLAVTLRKLVEAERKKAGTREEKLAAARDRFYLGDVADEMEAWYVATGAFLRKQDLAAQRVTVEEPVTVTYRGYTVYKCGPWTQGPARCEALRLLEGMDLRRMKHLSADYIHAVTESLKLALADRDEYYGDPAFVDVPLKALISEPYAAVRRPLVDMARASVERRPGDAYGMRPLRTKAAGDGLPSGILVQDTTTCLVTDRWGNVVAATPSCNILTNVPGPSGVNQGNRVRCLNTTLGHPNRVEPGKRPRVTLTPTMVCKDGKPVLAISVAGGDLQDQTTLNVLLDHVEFGILPEQAVVAPRFSTEHHQNSFDPNPDRSKAFPAAGSLHLSGGISKEVQAELTRRGHKVTIVKGPIAAPVMIYLDPKTGLIYAAGDPAAGRHAAAID